MTSFFPQTYEEGMALLNTNRRKLLGRPLGHNERLVVSPDGNPGVVYHATMIVEYLPNGHRKLANGGWNTSTTMQRMRHYGSSHVFSIRGEWYLRLEPNAKDPKPTRVDRMVPKPFVAIDPGPEPVKSDVGCIAGQEEWYEFSSDERIYSWDREGVRSWDFIVKREPSSIRDDEGVITVRRAGVDTIVYVDHEPNYWDREKRKGVTFKECPHCKAFDTLHATWSRKMHGDRWGRNFDQQTGYRVYAEMMGRYGTAEAWHEAYLADFRARRSYLKEEREWDERNRVPFFDGIEVNSDGYALRLRASGPSPAKLRRHEAAVKTMQNRIDKFVALAIDTLKEGMPMPSSGDCWYCSMKTEDGKTWGDMGDHDHLIQHMEEGYVVPSLLTNALLEHGYKPIGVYFHLGMDQDAQTMGGPNERIISEDSVRRDLRTYLKKRLIPAAPTE